MRIEAGIAPLPRQIEVLKDLESTVGELIQTHEAKRRLWWPSDLLGIASSDDPDRQFRELRERARGIPDPVRVSLAMGLLTEEGLPHFHRLIAVHMGAGYWQTWNNLWTAEEDRHGAVLHDYLWEARILAPRALEEIQFCYIKNGFHPDWAMDPYRLVVYTSLQERATQVAHTNNGRRGAEYDPLLGSILERVATEEARHFHFYRSVFSGILQRDPDHALDAIKHVLGSFEMPGGSMPGFREMTDVIRAAGLYGPRDFMRIVDEQLEYWGVAGLTGLSPEGRAAQEAVLAYPARFKRLVERMEQRSTSRTYRFDILDGRECSIE